MCNFNPIPATVKLSKEELEGIGNDFPQELIADYSVGLYNMKKKAPRARMPKEDAEKILSDLMAQKYSSAGNQGTEGNPNYIQYKRKFKTNDGAKEEEKHKATVESVKKENDVRIANTELAAPTPEKVVTAPAPISAAASKEIDKLMQMLMESEVDPFSEEITPGQKVDQPTMSSKKSPIKNPFSKEKLAEQVLEECEKQVPAEMAEAQKRCFNEMGGASADNAEVKKILKEEAK